MSIVGKVAAIGLATLLVWADSSKCVGATALRLRLWHNAILDQADEQEIETCIEHMLLSDTA
jgi:hypothetical protein